MAINDTIKDKILAWQIQNNEEAFVKAYDLYVDQIYRFVYFKINNREEAHDLTSQVFLKTWDYIQKKGLESKTLRALIYRIARNLIIDYYRRNTGDDIALENSEGQLIDIIDEKQNILKSVHNNLEIESVKRGMAELRDEYKEIIILHFIEELSITEIAKILNKSKGNIRILIHRSLKSLRKLL